MKASIDRAMIEYMNISDGYDGRRYGHLRNRRGNLDWNVLRMCVFLTLPRDEIIEWESAEKFQKEFCRLLEYYNISNEPLENADSPRMVRIDGYDVPVIERKVTSFYVLCLFVYSHVLNGENSKKAFLECMIVTPFCKKIEECFERQEDRKYMAEEYKIDELSAGLRGWDVFNQKVDDFFINYVYRKCEDEVREMDIINAWQYIQEAYYTRIKKGTEEGEEFDV